MKNIDPKRYQDAQDATTKKAINVAAIVRVISFDPAKMTVDVQPLSKHLEGGSYQSQPPILGVPVSCMRGGGFIFRPWYKKDDIGYVFYADHDIDKIVAEGKECVPNTERNHSTSDALGFVGIVTENAPVSGLPADAAVIATDSGSTRIVVKSDGVEIITSSGVTVKGSSIDLN